MKQLLAFLKATLLGGVLFVLPAWLAVLLVAKALMHLQALVKPLVSHLPDSIGHPRIIAILLLLAICFLVGLVIPYDDRRASAAHPGKACAGEAAKDDFSLFVRAYWPKQAITSGRWTAPAVAKLE